MPRLHLPFLCCLALALHAGDAPVHSSPPSPAVLVKSWVEVLRRGDLTAGLALLPPADRVDLTRHWGRLMSRPDPQFDALVDALITPLQAGTTPAAQEQVLAQVKPWLARIDPAQMARGITDIAGFLAMAANANQGGAAGGLDYSGLRDWLLDLAAWLPTAGLPDEAKARQAIVHLGAIVRATGVRSLAEFRLIPLPDLLTKLSPALPPLKELLALYDLPVDAFLDSFTCQVVEATAEHATITLGFRSLGRPRSFALRLINRNQSWELAPGNDNPLVGLSQLAMMVMLMQGMGATPAAPPATPPTVEDDGAL